jgi:tetratricopeptide (TPR) repeat protein
MLVRESVHQEWELMKWLVLLALAAALTLAFASGIVGAAEIRPPASLPDGIESWAAPMGDSLLDKPSPGNDLSEQVWRAIDLQNRELYEEAIDAWAAVSMPESTEVWKQIALGQAYLATGDLESAVSTLTTAMTLEAENPVVHYYRGLLRLDQAALANEWNDAVDPDGVQLIAQVAPDVVPNTRSMYKLAAIGDLEAAIEFAGNVCLDDLLVPAGAPTSMALEPSVRDLLLALRAEDFVAKSHNMLGSLHLERGSLELAEKHMDEAVAAGLAVVYGYSDLGKEYEAAGRHDAALRAYLKAAQQEPHKMLPLRKAWENFKDAIF